MVYTNLWQNADFFKLSDRAKLLYIGLITVADDDGRFKANSLLLRSQIFPLDEKITQLDVRKWLNEVVRAGLVEVYRENSEYFGQHPNWHKYQSIRKDLYKQSKLPPNSSRKRHGSGSVSKDKLSKDKIREEASVEFLKSIPAIILDEWYFRFDCSKKALVSKGEELYNYVKSHGKERTYKDFKLMMLNALKKDFPERKEPPRRYVRREDGTMCLVVDGPKIETPEEGSANPDVANEVKSLVDKMTIKNG